MLLPLDQLRKSKSRFDNWKDKNKIRPEVISIGEEVLIDNVVVEIDPTIPAGNIIGEEENLKMRKEMLSSLNKEPVDFAYERTIGNNDSVYSNFIELLLNAKRKIGRIVVKDGITIIGHATGFMVSEQLLLTNWHVFKSKNDALTSLIQFHYEYDEKGHPQNGITFELNPNAFFFNCKELDYCLVAVKGIDDKGINKLSDIGYIFLEPKLGKLGNEEKECLNIIHHPNGDYKQLSIRENTFTKILPTTLWYKSDTAQGSSGSPVFNDQWQVVALHHMGVGKKNDAGDYIDKNGDIIEIIDNKIDETRIVWIANEGIRISVIINHLKQSKYSNNPYVNGIFNPISSNNSISNSNFRREVIDSVSPQKNEPSDAIQVSIPKSILEINGTLNVSFSTKSNNRLTDLPKTIVEETPPVTDYSIAEESKKLERSMDYGNCTGYGNRFLGNKHSIAIPKPLETIENDIAILKDTVDATILEYHKYSVIFNAKRKLPLISAINVDGDLDKRLDKTKRVDRWIRDNRLDYAIQLDNSFYYKSGFSRGHMSRREDANWGITPEEAKRNADLTCVHTNACPQVQALNGAGGLWGKLEKLVLEKGAKKEEGKTGKISIFNGPIFKESDPLFRGTRIPLEFYKVICWVTSEDKLKVTAFKLSQITLVDSIDFEDLNIDENIQFKEYQCSLKSLSEETQINFSHLFEYDTFIGGENEQVEIVDEEILLEILK